MKKHGILFLILFTLMTLAPIPVFYLFREQIGYKNTENKAESEFPSLRRDNFSTFPRRFEAWLSDTLPFKTQFIELYRGFQYRSGLDFTQSDVIRGENDILFYRKTVENYKGISSFSDAELEAIEKNLGGFFERMEKNGAECLLYIAPDKEQVYAPYMPEGIRRVDEESRADRTVRYLTEHTDYRVLYPKAELQRLSGELPVYFTTDTHWNELGGYIAAGQVRSAFSGEPETDRIPEFSCSEEAGKDLAMMVGLSDVMKERNAVVIDYNDSISIHKTETIEHGTIQRFVSDAGTGKKLLIIGDSFSEYFLRSAIHDVDEVLFVTYGQLYRIDPEAEDPDLVVVMLVERNLPFLADGFY